MSTPWRLFGQRKRHETGADAMTGNRTVIVIDMDGPRNRLVLSGMFDFSNVNMLAEKVDCLKNSEKDCDVDLTETTDFDTECLKVLASLATCLSEHGKQLYFKVLADSAASKLLKHLGSALGLE